MKEKRVVFSAEVLNLFLSMDEIRKENNLKRINSIILLKALLEEKDSVFYECLCATSVQNPYKQIIKDCDNKLQEMKQEEKEIEEELTFNLKVGEEINKFFLTENFIEVLNGAVQLTLEIEDETEIYTDDILCSLLENTPKDVLRILRNNGVYTEAIMEYYDLLGEIYEANTEKEEDPESLPVGISDFAKVLSSKYKGITECEILGRDKECAKVMRVLQKRGKKNAILIGEPGVGKTAIAEKIAFDIANGNCPESLKDHIVIQVDVNSSIAGTQYRGMAEERFKLLVEYLNTHENVILFIDEIHMVIGAGATSGNDAGNMSNALKPFLASDKAKVIGATTEEEYEKHFSKDGAFKRRFERIIVKEPKAKEVYPMLKKSIESHEKFHGVKIEKDMVEYAVLISSCFNNTTNNPDRTNDLVDSAMVIAKEQGKEYVDRDCILENFDINFKKFKKTPKKRKYATSYHESGHYLVSRKSGRIENSKGIAVSIMPAEDYLGVTVYDDLSDEVTIYPDKNYYIDYVARMLAGRVAEELYTQDISAGAENDLKKANKLAYEIITKCGMSEKFGNRVFYEDAEVNMMSEKIRNEIDEEVRDFIEKATKRAKDIIEENKELLEKLVEALMEKGILDENDLEEICKDY